VSEIPLFHVGIDWGTQSHRVCVLDQNAKPIKQVEVKHTGQDIEALVDTLHRLSPEDHERVLIGLETKHGAVVEALVIHGFRVYSINPKQSDRFRDRHSPSGAKDDRLDAFVIADAVRTDLKCFRPVQLDTAEILLLRETTRTLQQTKEEFRISANRLWQQLHRYYAPLLSLCPAADEPWLWELIQLAPTPSQGRCLRTKAVSELLTRHRIRRLDAVAVLSALRQKPLPVAEGVAPACAQTVLLLVQRLQLLHSQQSELERTIKRTLAQLEGSAGQNTPPFSGSQSLPDAQQEGLCGGGASADDTQTGPPTPPSDAAILRSQPGVGIYVSATLLSEAHGYIKARDYANLRAATGIAAVTQQSGKSRRVVMRRACNLRLRNALHHWASVAIQTDAHMRAIYQRMRQAGKSYARALRGLGDHLLRVLIGALSSQTLYDPSRWPENQIGDVTVTGT
jgi:transposase